MKFQVVLALIALVVAVPFEGGRLHKRAGEKIHVGYRAVHKVGRIDRSDNHIA